MSTYKKQMKGFVQEYMQLHEQNYIEPRKIAEWAIRNKKWEPEKSALIKKFTSELSRILRDEKYTDPQGRKVRRYHVVISESAGTQIPIWSDIEFASFAHMSKSLKQRRGKIVGSCVQLKKDIDSYNDNYNKRKPIQVSFNFTYDLVDSDVNFDKVLSEMKSKRKKPTPMSVSTSSNVSR